MARTLLCLGHGYVAQALSRLLAPNGWRVIGTRRAAAADEVAEILPFDGSPSLDIATYIETVDAVLVSIPPDDGGDLPVRVFANAFHARGGWTGYLSTTGVYGDRAGGWVFEDDVRAPTSDPPRRRVIAEDQYLALPTPAHIFRLPGIYGPGRSAFDRLRTGDARRVVKPGLVLSRAHVDDIAAVLATSIAKPNPGRAYNVCDDEPAPPQDVVTHAALLLGVEPPPVIAFADAALPAATARFYMDSKRVSNARAKAELDWRPQFPSYREGLAAILAS
ncbi:MAG: SDR family oxidoreductase [Alphaproteobacteria bacterium]|nr:SDR family oxidoreductase [Alphaproteobacteria bacterium]